MSDSIENTEEVQSSVASLFDLRKVIAILSSDTDRCYWW
jgi:hypothetical protein